MPLPLTVSCFSKIQIGFTFLVPAHPSSPGQRAVKRVCVYSIQRPVFKVVQFLRNTIRWKSSAFHKVVLWHISGMLDKCVITSVKFLQDSVYQKLLKSVQFWPGYTEIMHGWRFLAIQPGSSRIGQARQSYANMQLQHISHVAAFLAYFSKLRISYIFFPQKLALLPAILITLISCLNECSIYEDCA